MYCFYFIFIYVAMATVQPFVFDNIIKPDWRRRQAATVAFGFILNSPSIEHLLPIIPQGLDFLLNVMQDQNSLVKATTTWTLGRIFDTLHSPNCEYQVVTPDNQQRIIYVLLVTIRDTPKVAERVCRAIYFLAKRSKDVASSILTISTVEIISALLCTADRIDVGNSNL